MARRKEAIKLVEQEEKCGCAVACIAMVLGTTYADVRKDWQNDFENEGVTTAQIIDYLGNVGFAAVYKRISHWTHKDFVREEMLTPFAPIHILSMRPAYDSKNYHVVVMDAEGVLYCPSGLTDEESRRSYLIDETIGLYK